MRQLIKNILNESKLALELLDTIKNENIFAAIDLVGGLENLKKIFKEFPEIIVPKKVADKALIPIQRMLELSK